MDTKIAFTVVATVVGIIGFVPYVKDIFLFKTKPHLYTWLIWSITQGTAILGIWYGGGGWGVLNLTVGTIFVIAIFLFSVKYGTKNITKSDTVILVAALCAILVWWQLHAPLISIITVSAIDFISYIPSFRKSFHEPWSETMGTWILFAISDIFAMLALSEYNLLTLIYLVSITSANIILVLICFLRRRAISKRRLS